MNVTINQLLSAILIMLLSGCSIKSPTEIVQKEANQQSEKPAKAKKPSALEICKADVGSPHYYRKAILIAGTTIVNDTAGDLPGLTTLTAQRLQTHLDQLKRFKVSAIQKVFNSRDTHTVNHVKSIGHEYASQFVIKLEIQDLTLHSPEGFFAELIEDKQRDVQIKLFIYDAEHGTLFYSQQYQGMVSGDVYGYPGYGSRVSTSLFNTDLGKKIDEMLKSMSEQINEQLACVPFATTVMAVRGDNIHINAGYLQSIKPGDSLRVYHRNEVRLGNGTHILEERDGWIQVKTVLPNKSIAKLKGSSIMTTGDILRAW